MSYSYKYWFTGYTLLIVQHEFDNAIPLSNVVSKANP